MTYDPEFQPRPDEARMVPFVTFLDVGHWWYLRKEQRSDRAAGAIEFQRISGT
jgi:hypothetical protein